MFKNKTRFERETDRRLLKVLYIFLYYLLCYEQLYIRRVYQTIRSDRAHKSRRLRLAVVGAKKLKPTGLSALPLALRGDWLQLCVSAVAVAGGGGRVVVLAPAAGRVPGVLLVHSPHLRSQQLYLLVVHAVGLLLLRDAAVERLDVLGGLLQDVGAARLGALQVRDNLLEQRELVLDAVAALPLERVVVRASGGAVASPLPHVVILVLRVAVHVPLVVAHRSHS